jgi:hypothetical protein
MARLNRAGVLAALACAGSAAVGGLALAQTQAAGTPPAWDVLVRCAQMGDRDDRLACFDEAMRAAGYAPKPEAVAEARRRLFGLRAPQINILKHKEEAAAPPAQAAAEAPKAKHRTRKSEAPGAPPREDEDNVTVTLAKVAVQSIGRLLMITDEGQIWEQIGDDPIQPLPKAGSAMAIHRGKLGGYFCDVNKYKSIRCTRLR